MGNSSTPDSDSLDSDPSNSDISTMITERNDERRVHHCEGIDSGIIPGPSGDTDTVISTSDTEVACDYCHHLTKNIPPSSIPENTHFRQKMGESSTLESNSLDSDPLNSDITSMNIERNDKREVDNCEGIDSGFIPRPHRKMDTIRSTCDTKVCCDNCHHLKTNIPPPSIPQNTDFKQTMGNNSTFDSESLVSDPLNSDMSTVNTERNNKRRVDHCECIDSGIIPGSYRNTIRSNSDTKVQCDNCHHLTTNVPPPSMPQASSSRNSFIYGKKTMQNVTENSDSIISAGDTNVKGNLTRINNPLPSMYQMKNIVDQEQGMEALRHNVDLGDLRAAAINLTRVNTPTKSQTPTNTSLPSYGIPEYKPHQKTESQTRTQGDISNPGAMLSMNEATITGNITSIVSQDVFNINSPAISTTTTCRVPIVYGFPPQEENIVGREQDVKALRHKMEFAGHRRVAITGKAGIGKTSLAMLCARLWAYPDQRFVTDIALIDAETKQKFVKSIRGLATKLNIAIDENKKTKDIIEDIGKYYNKEFTLLLIYDNVVEPQNYSIYSPKLDTNIFLLVTSPLGDLNTNLHYYSLKGLNEYASVALLKPFFRVKLLKYDKDLRKLARVFDGHPFGLVQAGSYIKQVMSPEKSNPKDIINDYVKTYKQYLDKFPNNIDFTHNRSVLTAILINIKKLEEKQGHMSTVTVILLLCLSYMDSSSIKEDIFKEFSTILINLKYSTDNLCVEKTLRQLNCFSLISQEQDDSELQIFKINRLIQNCCRAIYEESGSQYVYLFLLLIFNKDSECFYLQYFLSHIKLNLLEDCFKYLQDKNKTLHFQIIPDLRELDLNEAVYRDLTICHYILYRHKLSPDKFELADVWTIFDILRVRGLQVDSTSTEWTVLHAAALSEGCVEVLLSCFPDLVNTINSQTTTGQSALHVSAALGHVKNVTALCRSDCNTDLRDQKGYTPFDHALSNVHVESFVLLLKYSKEKNKIIFTLPTYENFKPAIELEEFSTSIFDSYFDEIICNAKRFLKYSSEISFPNAKGDILNILKHFTISTESSTDSQWSLIHKAALKDGLIRILGQYYPETVKAHTSGGLTALHISADLDHIDNVRYLVEELKCDVNRQDGEGRTAVHRAVLNWSRTLLQILLDNNVDFQIKDHYDMTAFDYLHENYLGGCIIALKSPSGRVLRRTIITWLRLSSEIVQYITRRLGYCSRWDDEKRDHAEYLIGLLCNTSIGVRVATAYVQSEGMTVSSLVGVLRAETPHDILQTFTADSCNPLEMYVYKMICLAVDRVREKNPGAFHLLSIISYLKEDVQVNDILKYSKYNESECNVDFLKNYGLLSYVTLKKRIVTENLIKSIVRMYAEKTHSTAAIVKIILGPTASNKDVDNYIYSLTPCGTAYKN